MDSEGFKKLRVQKLIREIIGRESIGLLNNDVISRERDIFMPEIMGDWDTVIEKIQYMPSLYCYTFCRYLASCHLISSAEKRCVIKIQQASYIREALTTSEFFLTLIYLPFSFLL